MNVFIKVLEKRTLGSHGFFQANLAATTCDAVCEVASGVQ